MLTIYSASAGTGKTHTLTGEYMSLLFKGKERHRHILAVTFTNKATAEMKSRIIEELFHLANNQPSTYIQKLSENGRKNETEIRAQAKVILRTILHDYSAFRISTIDHFFQQTLRTFTREIGLQGNYLVELDADLMLEKAMENMLAELEKGEKKSLIDWLLRFTEDKIEESGRWDIRNEIIKLGQQLFKETYKTYSAQIQHEIQQKQFLANYRDTLYQIIQTYRKKAKEFGEQGIRLMQQYGLQPSDFIRIHNSPFFMFEKLVTDNIPEMKETFRVLVDNPDGYLAKNASAKIRQDAGRMYMNGMNDLIRSVVSFYDKLTHYHTAQEITRNFYALGILTDLGQHIAKWREDNNKILIADTTELLNRIIDGSEIPFIYEKTGVCIEHYMIDEFQDTSVMQWSNFRPLLKDSLDNGRHNLIVGDVKQSIYRFRNSDWKLLDGQVKNDFGNQTKEETLSTNWRSCRHIVEFNNMLFRVIPEILQQIFNGEVAESSLPADEKESFYTRIESAYKNVEQQVAEPFKDKTGYVCVQFLTDTEQLNWKEQSLQKLPQIIEQLQDKGFTLRDIAILTRTNKEGLSTAETLLKYKETHPGSRYKYDIITEDSLTVGSSMSVRWMIEMFRYLSQPEVASYRELAQVAYALLCTKNIRPNIEVWSYQPFSPEINANLKQLSNRSLYELAEGLYRLFETDIPENELVYIQAFFDLIAEFSASETADLGRFLEWWDEKGNEKKISTPDSQNAIRIMTIHKSKGLGFKVVIIPFADWKVDGKEAILWCHPNEKPFNAMSLVPVRYGKILKDTIFASDYFTEKLHAYIDNLNTLYVAFTRAKEELIVMAPHKKTESAASIASLLRNGLLTDQHFLFDTENGLYERKVVVMAREEAVIEMFATGKKKATRNVTAGSHPFSYDLFAMSITDKCPVTVQSPAAHDQPQSDILPESDKSTAEIEEWPMERMHSISPDKRMLLRLNHVSGLSDDKKRKFGLLMHDILSNIVTREDITRALYEKQASGEIDSEEAESLKEKLLSLTAESEVYDWFNGSMQVMNETDILFGKGKSLRPDRIMIDQNSHVILVDYKSGDQKEKAHQRQLEKYTSLIREMGYKHVTGYIWYISLNNKSLVK